MDSGRRLSASPPRPARPSGLDIAVDALAAQGDRALDERAAPRRIRFVVDPRIVVDEASERASEITRQLAAAIDGPLREVADRLRAVSPPLAVERWAESTGGRVLYRFRRAWSDGSSALRLAPAGTETSSRSLRAKRRSRSRVVPSTRPKLSTMPPSDVPPGRLGGRPPGRAVEPRRARRPRGPRARGGGLPGGRPRRAGQAACWITARDTIGRSTRR